MRILNGRLSRRAAHPERPLYRIPNSGRRPFYSRYPGGPWRPPDDLTEALANVMNKRLSGSLGDILKNANPGFESPALHLPKGGGGWEGVMWKNTPPSICAQPSGFPYAYEFGW